MESPGIETGPPGIISGPAGIPGFGSIKSGMSGMEDAEIERVLREYDIFQAAKAGLLIPCQASGGHVPVVDLLLEAGSAIDAVDHKGCSPLITASQYGRTNLTGYLLGRGARYQLVDREGDNALHWAAFKGNCEMCRLLIYSGFNPKQRDNFGQTPLHLGCLSGSLNTVQVLVEQDIELEAVDFNGNVPKKLAEGRKHWEIVRFLEKAAARQNSVLPSFDLRTVIFGPPGRTKTTMHFMLSIIFFIAYPTYLLRVLPTVTVEAFPICHLIFWCANLVMWVNLIRVHNTDPGLLPRNTEEYSEKIKAVARYDKWGEGDDNPLARLCHTCRCVKPPRAKHCKVSNRCVKRFDHHCAYVGTSIGYHNQHYFMLFLSAITMMMWVGHYLCFQVQQKESHRDWWIVFVQIFVGFFTVLCSLLCGTTAYNAAKNLTINEQVNFRRYDYLKDGIGQFSNPFDRGVKMNLKEYFHLQRSVEEVTNPEIVMSV